MIGLLYRLIVGSFHRHEWKIIRESRLDYEDDFGRGSCIRYTLRCQKCGKLKKQDLK